MRTACAGVCLALSLGVHAVCLQALKTSEPPAQATAVPRQAARVTALPLAASHGHEATATSPAEQAVPTDATTTRPPPASSLASDSDADTQATGHDTTFLPRSALTVPPVPLADIRLDYPPGAPTGTWQTRVTLFIDAQGTVRKVLFDGPLPAALAENARQVFLSTRYAPGERQGRPVNARLRIELTFEAGDDVQALRAP